MELRDKDYIICQSDQRIYNAEAESYLYPDIAVIKEPAEYVDDFFDTITNPLLLIEVLSEGTEAYDRGDKFRIYRNLPSFKEYILVAQDKYLVESFYKSDKDLWKINSYNKAEDSLIIQSLEISIALSEVYRKIKFG